MSNTHRSHHISTSNRNALTHKDIRAFIMILKMKSVLERAPQPAQRQTSFTTISGRPIERVYTPEHLAGIDYERDIANPGEFPYTRGIHATGYRGKLWTMRQF